MKAVRFAIESFYWMVIFVILFYEFAGFNPHWFQFSHYVYIPQPALTRTIQLKPCDPWDTMLGRWYEDYICEIPPRGEFIWRKQNVS